MSNQNIKLYLFTTDYQRYDCPEEVLGKILALCTKSGVPVVTPIDFIVEKTPEERTECTGLFGGKSTRVTKYSKYDYYLVFKSGTTNEQLDYWRMFKCGLFFNNNSRY